MKINGKLMKRDDHPQLYTPRLVNKNYDSMRINLHKKCGLVSGSACYEIEIPGIGLLIVPVENMGKIELSGRE